MTNGFFHVIPDDLRQASEKLSTAMDVVREINGRHDSAQVTSSDAGHTGAATAINNFIKTWSYGLSMLEQDGRTLADMLQAAGTAYGATDNQIAGAL